MSKADTAVSWARAIAADNSHGYDQQRRQGPDYDCSSFVIAAWEQAGVPVKTRGATYTGNMKKVFLSCGFKDVTSLVNLVTGSGMLAGDVLLNEVKHTALHIGNRRIVHAAGNELGRAIGGLTGDQTGGEITERTYYNGPWDCVLRFEEMGDGKMYTFKPEDTILSIAEKIVGSGLPVLSVGSSGEAVRALQNLLILRGKDCGPDGADGDFGGNTLAALVAFSGVDKSTPQVWRKLIG